jgi:hypothetical protein
MKKGLDRLGGSLCQNGTDLVHLAAAFGALLQGRNPIGFGPGDFAEIGLAVLVVAFWFGWPWLEPFGRKLVQRPAWCAALLFGLVIALRLALLPLHPVPTPAGADDFSYLLLGDTLAHFRLTNPTHPMHEFFETTFVLQTPTYSSIYPLGPAIMLALGQLVFGLPWAGVVLSVAAFCALCFWMLRGWTTPGWAFLGGLLAVWQFGPLNMWMNCYWGGAVSASAGCLVFGALPRLRERFRARDAVLLGLGLGVQLLSRPFESLFLGVSVVLFFLGSRRIGASRVATNSKPESSRARQQAIFRAFWIAILALLPAAALLLLHNQAVTGSWMTLPYMASRYLYGVPTTFTFQPNAVPHSHLTAAQQLYYEGQAAVHGDGDSPGKYVARLVSRAGFYRFFLLPPLWAVVPFFLLLLREFRFIWVLATILLFALGTNFYPYFFPHYIAAITCLFVLVAVLGLERLSRAGLRGVAAGRRAAQSIVFLCAAHFLFWYGIHLFGGEDTLNRLTSYETAAAINFGDPGERIAMNRQLAEAPGRQLVFVRYYSTHEYHEWIHNSADIDQQRVVWALELTPAENAKLRRYYPDRTVWLLEPDATPPRLSRYQDSGPFLPVQ